MEKRRTWWSIYAFEKLHSFELGKASCILDHDCNQLKPPPLHQDDDAIEDNPRSEFAVVINLAETLSTISRSCVRARNKEEAHGNSDEIALSAIVGKVRTVGESCMLLKEWADALEDRYRPTSDLLCAPQSLSFTVFLSLQYNNA